MNFQTDNAKIMNKQQFQFDTRHRKFFQMVRIHRLTLVEKIHYKTQSRKSPPFVWRVNMLQSQTHRTIHSLCRLCFILEIHIMRAYTRCVFHT